VRTVLHVLCQRPALTGSGVTLERLATEARALGWRSAAVVGVPVDAPAEGAGLDGVVAVRFASGASDDPLHLPHPVVGMSDVMPYDSRTWSSLDARELEAYERAFTAAIERAVAAFAPDVVHVHHAWLAAALARRAVPERIPVVVHGHGSDLRQIELAPAVATRARADLARVDRLVALHPEQAAAYARHWGIDPARTEVVGSGFDPVRFDPTGRERWRAQRIVFVGKLARAKGVDALLEAFARVRRARPRAELVLVGGGGGEESEALRARARELSGVVLAGRLDDGDLVRALQSAAVFALPSLWEGVPLVLLEAAAAGALAVATDLPGVEGVLAEPLGDALHLVRGPRSEGGERCADGEFEPFVERLEAGLRAALDAARRGHRPDARRLAPFTWRAVTERVGRVWSAALDDRAAGVDRGPGAP